ncbi:hypothetical protein [Actibacterium sp. XHP0104]|uniref:hypothetical protein n=1 Tax=Actibacterium sp. XHP0104 TaxID=2984335 RepID=UPI0021E90E39|nr:hypothetical protein [Actibacterium sp. XHP0104]MCV2880572.1 hypothetical protein [Actibacterium sp. XHP0104]
MFIELIATVAAGLGAAGIILLLNKILRGMLPRWFLPAGAGLAMIGFSVWSEYTWAERTINQLPEGVVVVREIEQTAAWKPWSYAKPQITRVIAVDLAGVQRRDDMPDLRLFTMLLYGRWLAPSQVPQLFDCSAPARADVTDAALANPMEDANWQPVPADDELYEVLCNA